MNSPGELKIYLEIGKKRTIAGAIAWPGWCRVAQDEAASIQALHNYRNRYARVLHAAHIDFQPPADVSAYKVIERIAGNATTDFGTPGLPPASDALSVDESELGFLHTLWNASWQAFDAAASMALGKELRTGPRGGLRWAPRYFVRRAAWHVVDHAWEIEDRIQ